MTRYDLQEYYRDFQTFVNPELVRRAELSQQPWQWMRARDGALFDTHEKPFLDFVSGWGTQIFGPRPPAIERALRDFLDSDAPSIFTTGISPWSGMLARILHDLTGYDRAFFVNGGTEAVECALKLARAATRRPVTLYLEGAYHGCTLGSCAMMHHGVYRDPFEPHPTTTFVALPWNDIDALRNRISQGDVCAVVIEPIQVEGGLRTPSAAYIDALCALTKTHDVLLIADEIQTGLGRLGSLLHTASWPRLPDVITLAKALGGGVMPISAMLTRRAWYERAYGDYRLADAHNTTYGGNALACLCARATLSLLDPPFLSRVQTIGQQFGTKLKAALQENPLVANVRGDGLLWGIEMKRGDDVHPWLSFSGLHMDELGDKPSLGLLLCHRLYRAGFYCQVCGHDWAVLRIQPALNITESQLDSFVSACTQELEFLCQLA